MLYNINVKPLVFPPSSKTKQLIVAKYKENTRWVKKVFQEIPTIIYNKYDKQAADYLPNIPSFPVHRFDGVKHQKTPTGRESHTYLYHIIKHYHSLADINIFLQGNPIEIGSVAIDPLRVFFKNDFENIQFAPLNFPLVICDKRGAPLHTGLPMERMFNRLFKTPCPDYFAYAWGAMFCVTKERIMQRSLNFYEEMMQMVYEEPLSGYVYERMWPAILGCEGFIAHEHFPKYDRGSWQMPGLLN